ncbi:ATP nucleotide 3'-pyrophosphokinase [Streptomyces sp. NRRL B-1677]|uniref:ATP nucleotide 3'-pyrophosphokinase n=1 Tax=Streptomyces klenkii TaxID=1420899 RepID=A0A3B0BD13_9ACTN|nr:MULTISPECIES: ATP nucleotide 3'-pyrophosphokinase [Streptomyces]MBF6044504.1 ATP nucleotide 3'-pyrophosphokinase [Streptomyces sp. NRRL B-1677]RKN69937.1 ATP nucleotide 3'-pyrophosphokinase [Streptomyces klenkii]
MITNRTAPRLAAVAALAAALSAGPVQSALADGRAGSHPVSAGKTVAAAGAAEPDKANKADRFRDDKGGWKGDGLSLNAADNKKVDEFLARARSAEQTVSPEMQAVARISHATLIGFDHRLKSPDSLKRKVATAMKETPGQTVDATLARISDSVRYTLQWPDGSYTNGVTIASSALSLWGNDSVKWANTWGRKHGYKAINAAWRDPHSRHVFEVQFHTPSSKWAQEATHKLYEEQRLPTTSPERARELQEQQNAIFESVPVPDGAEDLTLPAAPAQGRQEPARTLPAPVDQPAAAA